MSPEQTAQHAAQAALEAVALAIHAYQEAGYGSQVTDPLREAFDLIAHSIKEVKS